MKKIVSGVLAIGLVLVSIPFLYAKATFEKRVDQLYQRKLKILMAPATEEMKPHIKEVAKCQVEMFDSKRFNDSFFRNFVHLLRRVSTEKDDHIIRELAVRVDAFEGSQKFLSVKQKTELVNVLKTMVGTDNEDLKTIMLLLIWQIKNEDCVLLLKGMQPYATGETLQSINGYLLEAKTWGEDHH